MRKRRGTSLIWVMVAMPPLIGMCSLAVDLGRVQMVKTELSRAADAAARYASTGLSGGISTVRTRAKDAADDNTADGTPVILTDADIQQGNWSTTTRTFTANGTPLNAVRITAHRSGANAVPLMLARVFGKASCDVEASAIAMYVAPTATTGFVGLNGINASNNVFYGSYNSSSTTSPTKAGSTAQAGVGSNGVIQFNNNAAISGLGILGPVASISGVVPTLGTTRLSSPIATPAEPAWSPGTNPGGAAQSFSLWGSNVANLPGGTYWFTSISLSNDSRMNFTGPATVYLNGNLNLSNNTQINAFQSKAANLTIHMIGDNRSLNGSNDTSITAQVSAPRGQLNASNNFSFRGTGVFRTIQSSNDITVFVDDAITGGSGGGGGSSGTISVVK